MKKLHTVLFILLSTTISLFGQTKPKTEPFIIQGQILESPENYLVIQYNNLNADGLCDTLKLDESGKFYLKTLKVKTPQIVKLVGIKNQIRGIYIAPGYNLTLTANWKDYSTLCKTEKITGIGAESNRYRIVVDSIWVAKPDTTIEVYINENDFLKRTQKSQKFSDSLNHAIFDRKPIQDKYLQYMGSLTRLNRKFSKLDQIIQFTEYHKYNHKKSIDFVRNNFENDILNNIYRDEYLKSDNYKYFMSTTYPFYLVRLDLKTDSTIQYDLGKQLEKINKVYTGKIKDYALNFLMGDEIPYCRSLENLNGLKVQFKPYISNLTNLQYKRELNAKFSERSEEFVRMQVGNPAPKFVLESNLGKTFSIEDFKGKVVYLDLWASWCVPCRKQTPFFKILYDKFRTNNQVAFISIAVLDVFKNWKKALETDKPDWIQLIDKDEIVSKSYGADHIPKFILIDKKGNIVNFNAPWPSSGVEIEELINNEIAK
jgi:thiol-disulfide isomerase/thioredoxin